MSIAIPPSTPARTADEQPYERTDGPVHTWFSLSYANFLTWPRAYMQSMPLEWQRRFVELAEELAAAYPDTPAADYEVKAVEWTYVCELTDAQMTALGVGQASDDEDAGDEPERDREYCGPDGQTLQAYDYFPVPVPDPAPHYNRGRTYLPPDEEGIAAHRRFREQTRAEDETP